VFGTRNPEPHACLDEERPWVFQVPLRQPRVPPVRDGLRDRIRGEGSWEKNLGGGNGGGEEESIGIGWR
jgi:hypothetical protein